MSGSEHAGVPERILGELRAVCLGLPEAYEEAAWVGIRWCVRKKNFAHVVTVEPDWPPVYARVVQTVGPFDEPVTVLTFRSSGPELDALSNAAYPFFRPRWAPNIVGMVLDDDVDWDELAELVTESYCVLAPAKLVAQVDRPTT